MLASSTRMLRKAKRTVSTSEAALCQGQDREQKPDPDDGHIPQRPQPEHRLGFQIIRVDIYGQIPPNEKDGK